VAFRSSYLLGLNVNEGNNKEMGWDAAKRRREPQNILRTQEIAILVGRATRGEKTFFSPSGGEKIAPEELTAWRKEPARDGLRVG